MSKNFKNQQFWPPNFWTPQIMNIRIALAHVHPCTKFGVPRFKGVRARGQKAEKIKLPLGAQFWPLGVDSPIDTQFRPRRFWPESLGSRPLPVWAATLTQHFSKGSRGGTWHVPGGTQRHVTAAIIVPPFEWSNEPSLVRIGPAVPALFIGHLSFTNSWRHEGYQLTTCPQVMIENWNVSKTI